MPAHQSFVTRLLRIYHGRESICAGQLDSPQADEVEYFCDVGLGPIAFRVYGDVLRESDPDLFSVLQSADLTTRVIYKQIKDAAVESLGSLQSAGVTPILLKGISTADEFYSPAHLRVMGDVDILIKKSDVDVVMSRVTDLGYEIADEAWSEYFKIGHHHLPEARHPKTGISIEVHTGLFAPGKPVEKEAVFQTDSIEAQKVEFDYNGIRVARFTPEFQLIFAVSKWSGDGNWASNLTSINDAIHILRKYESELDWSTLSGWFASKPWLYANVAVLINYLEQADVVTVSPQMRNALALPARAIKPMKLKLMMWLLHDYPFNARGKTRDGDARRHGHAIWLELNKKDSSNFKILKAMLRAMIGSVHHGEYNPLGWIVSAFKPLAR